MIQKHILVLLIFLIVFGCNSNLGTDNYRMVGDILHDPKIDNENFSLCNGDARVIQYYALGENTYGGEKLEIRETFENYYRPEEAKKESGLIRIRFIVNCKGETGRFRVLGMDEDYQEKTFDSSVTDQLLKITKSLNNWKNLK